MTPRYTPLQHTCYHVKFGRSVTKGVRYAYIERNSKNWGALGRRPFGGGGATGHLKQLPPPYICYHVKFGSSATKAVCINIKEPPKWGALGSRLLGVDAWLAP